MDVSKIKISKYNNAFDKESKETAFDDFINGIKNGTWQDDVLKVRTITDKSERQEFKKKCPLFTVSGSFSERKDKSIRKHSGFLAIDIDEIDNPNIVKDIIKNDPYIYAAFISISGKGLCLIFKIDGSRHEDSFRAIESHLYNAYSLISDKSCVNVSRARFVSYDPYIYINESAVLFKKYLPKPKVQKVNRIVYVQTDLDNIVNELYTRGINLCENYEDWISVAYSLIDAIGECGLNHFHTLSSLSSKYNSQDTDKQFDSCFKNHTGGKVKLATIDSLYYKAKLNGIDCYSQETKEVIRTASSQLKNGVSKNDIIKGLEKFNNIPEEISSPIVDQVIEKKIEHVSENVIEDICAFLKPYNLRKNLISRNIEMNKKAIDDTDINSLFVECKSSFDKVTKDLVCSVIFSNKIEQYNPIIEFFNTYKEEDIDTELPNLTSLINSIQTDTPNYEKWVTKWLVSIIASAHGEYSPLMLVLSGGTQGTGKTYWFRYLLPKELRNLFAESKMDNGKDDEILMTKKIIILDDEYGGKSKKEEKKLKEITSKEFINVREPYGRVSVDLRRLSVFCGTSNDSQILNDPTGNRRILPINILGIDKQSYNDCDKTELWKELYYLYKNGYDFTVLSDEIKLLNDSTEMFKASSIEEELILDKLYRGEYGHGEYMTITSIIQYIISDTKYNNLSNTRVGLLLSTLGYTKKRKRINGTVMTTYYISKTYAPQENYEF